MNNVARRSTTSARTARTEGSTLAVPGLAAALTARNLERATEILVEQYGEDVYRYCRRLLGSDADGDDAAQTVFVQAFADLDRLAEVDSPRAWLLAIARHRCLDRLKALRRGARLAELQHGYAATEAALGNPRDEATDPRMRRALDDCLDRLDARTRALLVLRFHDELSYDEISALTSDTPGALRVRLARSLPALRSCIEGKLERKEVAP